MCGPAPRPSIRHSNCCIHSVVPVHCSGEFSNPFGEVSCRKLFRKIRSVPDATCRSRSPNCSSGTVSAEEFAFGTTDLAPRKIAGASFCSSTLSVSTPCTPGDPPETVLGPPANPFDRNFVIHIHTRHSAQDFHRCAEVPGRPLAVASFLGNLKSGIFARRVTIGLAGLLVGTGREASPLGSHGWHESEWAGFGLAANLRFRRTHSDRGGPMVLCSF
jgi:hypothetical protein